LASPLEQFEIETVAPLAIGGWPIQFTNSSLWMAICLAIIGFIMLRGLPGNNLVPNRWQALMEGFYGFVDDMAGQSIGAEGKRFVPLLFSLFIFILVANFAGLLPIGVVPGGHAFTVTSHLTVTAILAVIAFGTVLVVGLARHGLHFFSLFVPQGVPGWLMPVIVPVEFVSFFVRPFSLAIRLFVAMTAGHILLKVLATFIVDLGNAGGVVSLIAIPTFLLLVAITALELLVAAIQAYVFAILTSLYLNDAVHLH